MGDLEARSLRIGNAEREQAAEALGEHFSAGRLDPDEFDERVHLVYQAKTASDLEPLFADLPRSPSRVEPVRSRDHARRHVPVLPILLFVLLIAWTVTWVSQAHVPPFFIFPLIWLFWGRNRTRGYRH
ncbi:DUF1707 SHOCT-like domain-containing protein [Jatrophihabitans sp. DSM 45814]